MSQEFDNRMMERCIELARQAKLKRNTPVGSLITLNGEIIAEAEERTPAGDDMFAHSEIEVVRRACQNLKSKLIENTTLYTTAEPCFLCSYAIRKTGVSRVVIGSKTPYIGGASSNYPILRATDIVIWLPPPEIVFISLPYEI